MDIGKIYIYRTHKKESLMTGSGPLMKKVERQEN
jgi:hypothetical protein